MTTQKPTPAVYIVGSSGAGKSTLAKALAERLGWRYVPLSAGAAYARHGVTFDQAEADPVLMQRIQTEICMDADHAIGGALEAGTPFVTDRAIDYGVYTALMCPVSPNARNAVMSIKLAMQGDGAAVLFCRPVREIIHTARQTDQNRAAEPGGKRSKFLKVGWVDRVDAGVTVLLRTLGIPFTEIGPGTRAERLDRATAVVFERICGAAFKELRADGWPLCPSCGEDELHNSPIWTGTVRPPLTDLISMGLACYRCNWKFVPDKSAK